MDRYDRLFLDPAEGDLLRALQEATALANQEHGDRVLSWPLDDLAGAFAEVAHLHEGRRLWNSEADGFVRRGALLAWWSDRAGRRHVRVVGCADDRGYARTDDPCPREAKELPLRIVHPHRTFFRTQAGTRQLLVLCACGVFGTPDEVGWMGDCCGPCHDRREADRVEGAAGPFRTLAVATGMVSSAAFLPDGITLAVGSGDSTGVGQHSGAVLLWDLHTGNELPFLDAEGGVRALAVSPDGQTLAVVGGNGATTFIDLASGQVRWTERHRPPFFRGAFAGSSLFATGGNGHVVLWDVATAQRRASLAVDRSGGGSALTAAPDGKTLAWNHCKEGFLLWDLESGTERTRWALPGYSVGWLAFSPDGRTLAVGPGVCRLQDVMLWDVATGQARLLGRFGHVAWSLRFAPDGRTLVAGTNDGKLLVWDVVSGQGPVTLERHTSLLRAAAFSPDGALLATGGGEGTVQVWPAEVLRPATEG